MDTQIAPQTAPPEIDAPEIVGRHFEETLARISFRNKQVAAAKAQHWASLKLATLSQGQTPRSPQR